MTDSKTMLWAGFFILMLGMLALDLGVFHRKAHEVKTREALIWSAVWVALALLFCLGIYFVYSAEKAEEFLAGYLLEKSLSVDNIFVFLLVFTYFQVSPIYQHKVLFWGIIGALIMRAILILAGISLIQTFHWLIYIFGAFLIVAGVRMAFQKDKKIQPEKNPVIRLSRWLLPVTDRYENGRFFTRRGGRFFTTPLFIVLIFVETTDLFFAMDSIPAIFSITYDPFIVYTSNVFAILGLRALYFAVAGTLRLFRYLHYGLAVVLVFAGAKLLLSDVYKIPVSAALSVIAGILLVSVVASVLSGDKLEA
jgi:tellurite resistance protein TerC